MRRVTPLLAALAVLLALPAGSAAQVQVGTCPATFQVLHDDRIGRLQLPAGAYRVTVNGVTCPQSTQLFAEFLQDWNGVLPRPWSYRVLGVGRGRFINGRQFFTVERAGGGGGGGGNGLLCRTRVRLAFPEDIGALALRRGTYEVIRLTPRISCARALALFDEFLQDFSGDLPGGWTVLPDSAAFVRGSLSFGFRVKLAPGRGPRPRGGLRCAATFRVLNDDRIGRLRLPAGNYYVYLFRGSRLTCPQTSTLFAEFLSRPDGNLPRPWRLNAARAAFTRGSGPTGFRVQPVSR